MDQFSSHFYVHWTKEEPKLPNTVHLEGEWEVALISLTAEKVYSLSSSNLILCSNLCEPSIVGGGSLAVVRELSRIKTYQEFNVLQYRQVRQTPFNRIDFELIDYHRRLLPNQFQSCVLHFRRRLCEPTWCGSD